MKLVILGGGFCGLEVLKSLKKYKNIEITLIDKKTYFEYKPSFHKVAVNLKYKNKILIPYNPFLNNAEIIDEKISEIRPKYVRTEKKKINFDYLVISTGIDYPIFLKNKKNVYTLDSIKNAQRIGQKLKLSKNILIVGGGLIGTEIGSEIVKKYPNKRITIVHPPNRLIERNPKKASKYAHKFFAKYKTKIIYGQKVVDNKNGVFITDKNKKIKSDFAIWCAGIKSNPNFMKNFNPSIFTEKNALEVNKYLQLVGYPNIFVGGDINSVIEEKTAQNSEIQAKLIAKNIVNHAENKPLYIYKNKKRPLIISLGNKDGLIIIKNNVIKGIIPALLKKLIEVYTLFKYR